MFAKYNVIFCMDFAIPIAVVKMQIYAIILMLVRCVGAKLSNQNLDNSRIRSISYFAVFYS